MVKRYSQIEPVWSIYIDGKLDKRLQVTQHVGYAEGHRHYDVQMWTEAHGAMKAHYQNIVPYGKTDVYGTLSEAKQVLLKILNADDSLAKFQELSDTLCQIDDAQERERHKDALNRVACDTVNEPVAPSSPIDVRRVINGFLAQSKRLHIMT